MKLFLTALGLCLFLQQGFSQEADSSWKKMYRATTTVENALVHTKLDVKFDFKKSYLYGNAWLTLKPYFYSTDSLTLDAKGMDIQEIAIINGTAKRTLQYAYDSMQLKIKLDRVYKSSEKYTVYIKYTAKPDEYKSKGSAAITNAKGLYFINPRGEEKDKPTQIWTQGETEANSVWMPTIDKPNQKTTEEIYITVPNKYVTLSNGLLISKKVNVDGTRTDYWKMDLPHAPYLFFMGVGEYSIVKDKYKNKEVSYYVEKEFEPVARKIYGTTPEMIAFFSNKLGVEYPWAKYSQIVGRDFVSGAMENTTATLHQESANQNARQLTDGNIWEETICHELFHQWFGDLVTTESWSNITVNESFANYSEVIWDEYKHGKDFADDHNFDDMQGYLFSESESKDLVRFYYADKEDVFDAVSYNKGGRILHMLRNYVGDEAFFASLNKYLTDNKFKTGEAAQLRLAFEAVTGKDMNWFWNQWYYGSGHPKLDISYSYDAATKKAHVFVAQKQETGKIFLLPIKVDVYNGKQKKTYNVWLKNQFDTLSFDATTEPDLINVDADKILLCEKTDNKTKANFIFQYKNAPNFLDRYEALDYFAQNQLAEELKLGLTDKYEGLRRFAIGNLSKLKAYTDDATVEAVEKLVKTEKDKKAKAAAIKFLAAKKDAKYMTLFESNINDSSYSVAGAALDGILKLDEAKAYQAAKKISGDSKGALNNAIMKTYIKGGNEADYDFVCKMYDDAPLGQDKIALSADFAQYLEKVNNNDKVKTGIDRIIKFRNSIPEQYRVFTDPAIKKGLDKLGKTKGADITEYINNAFN